MSRPTFKEPTARTILTREMALMLNAEEWEQAEGIAAVMLKAQQAAQPLEWELEANGKLSPLDAETLETLRGVTRQGNEGLAILVMKATARRQLPKQN